MVATRQTNDENVPSQARRIVALIVTAALVIAVWKFIDWRMQPPPPPATNPSPAPTR